MAANNTKVTIFEVTKRPWGELMTTAEADDRIYVGSQQWHQQSNNNQTRTKSA